MAQSHITHLTSDYVLGLMPANQRQRVEYHVAWCERCRQSLSRERRLHQLIQETMGVASIPSPARLAALRPPVPSQNRFALPPNMWQRFGAAAATVCLIGMVWLSGTKLMGDMRGMSGWGNVPAASAVAVTATSEPTATVTATQSATEMAPTYTPMPAGTPIAALAIGLP